VGAALEYWSLEWTTAGESSGSLLVHRLKRWNPVAVAMSVVSRAFAGSHGILPPHFRRTMAAPDPRLPELSQGLGVMDGGRQRFYPSDALTKPVTEEWGERSLRVALSEARIPEAIWDDGSRPMQLFTRWYGFSLTFPGCELYSADEA
jgi:hypothetical protein